MARMIPPFYDEGIVSDGEKKLFEILKCLDDDYYIIHSLGISDHREKVFGEIDFVIICQKGILCLEVKGGHVRREDGVWYFTDRYGKENKKTEGPFMQVFSSMHSLRQHLKSQFGKDDSISKCQYACGVVFADMPFTQTGPDIVREIVFDTRNDLEKLDEYIDGVFRYWKKNLQEKRGFSGGGLSPYHMRRVIHYLRGDFGFVPNMGYIVQRTEENLLRLTSEQMDRLSIASENDRIVLSGGAGTGKTLLSLEYARRAALRGDRVLYLCYNRNLFRNLEFALQEDDSLTENISVNTFHGYLNDFLSECGALPDREEAEDMNYYYNILLPETFLKVVSCITYQTHDTLVVDEGQDLLRCEYILCFDAMITRGLSEGKWHICYDRNQNIYNKGFDEGLDIINEYRPTFLTLDTNCRNTRPIGVTNTLCTGIEPARFLKVGGEQVITESYKDYEEERARLIKTVRDLLKGGVNPGDIVLLSRYKYENSCLGGENIFETTCTFQNASSWEPGQLVSDSLKFCTVHSFKGLEAPVVVLLDVKGFKDEKDRVLNYTGMSRAKALLYVFYDESAQGELEEMMDASSDLLSAFKEHTLIIYGNASVGYR